MTDWLEYLVLSSTAAMAVSELACLALRAGSAAQRHLIRLLGFAALLALPVVPLATDFRLESSQSSEVVGDVGRVSGVDSSGSFDALALGAGIVSAVLLARFMLLLSRAPRRSFASMPYPETVGIDMARCLGIRRQLTIASSAHIRVPETYGLLQPTILLPLELPGGLKGLELCLAHELIHIRRNDWVAQVFAKAICALFWFQPMCWYALHRLKHDAERACDDEVLGLNYRASDYAAQLLEVSRSRVSAAIPQLTVGMAGQTSDLELRVQSILDPNLHRKKVSMVAKFIAVGVALGVAFTLAAIAAPPAQQSPEKKDPAAAQKSTVREHADRVMINGKMYARYKPKTPAHADGKPYVGEDGKTYVRLQGKLYVSYEPSHTPGKTRP